MSSFQCPFCSSSMAISDDTLCKRNVSFESSDGYEYPRGMPENTYSNIELSFYKCPNCNRYTVFDHPLKISTLFLSPNHWQNNFQITYQKQFVKIMKRHVPSSI